MSPVRAVLFDLDGVLIDSYHLWFHVLNHATERLGFPPVSPADFHRTWGQGVEKDIEAFFPGTLREDLEAFYNHHYVDHLDHLRREPGALEVLTLLRGRDLPLACMTNTPGDMARRVLDHTGLLSSLDRVMGADEAGRSKPAPDGLIKLCEAFGVRPEEAVMVGDSVYDQAAADAAGVPFVGLRMEVAHRIDMLEALVEWVAGR